MMELPEEIDPITAVLDVVQHSAIDHIKESVDTHLATLTLTVYVNADGEPSCSATTDGNIFTIVGATEMWLLNEKGIK